MRTAIIEDNAGYRNSLKTLLRLAPGFGPVVTYPSAVSALRDLEQGRVDDAPWDLVLMDIDLPELSGIDATRRVKQRLPRTPVVMLTVFEDPATILEAICAGADGYLLKKTSAPEVLSQLRAITTGGAPMTMGVARTVLDLLRTSGRGGPAVRDRTAPPPGGGLDLTAREREVLQCLVRGQSYQQSAYALGVSLDTVRSHIQGVYRKLQVHRVSEAVSRAIRDRLV